MMAMSVNSFETDPTRYAVEAVAGTSPLASRAPNPSAQTTSSPSTSAIETAASSLSARSRSIAVASSAATSE